MGDGDPSQIFLDGKCASAPADRRGCGFGKCPRAIPCGWLRYVAESTGCRRFRSANHASAVIRDGAERKSSISFSRTYARKPGSVFDIGAARDGGRGTCGIASGIPNSPGRTSGALRHQPFPGGYPAVCLPCPREARRHPEKDAPAPWSPRPDTSGGKPPWDSFPHPSH